MKGQMFVVAIVFLVGLIFIIQQILFQYTFMDISDPLRTSDAHIVRSITKDINQTIKTTLECNETDDSFKRYLEELDSMLKKEETGKIYVIYISKSLECNFWNNMPPAEAPLNISVRVTGLGKDTTGSFKLYHIYE
ncbi:MAG: hypothetical protein GTN76_00675 [Candidatus Aenigmarchaeota archaeon]|nr:hypothetical protein [Candidatus Aenigmarchaeota archaeon]